jgi:hypothetical protein
MAYPGRPARELLKEARQHGLEVLRQGDQLVVRCPRHLRGQVEPLVRELQARAPEVLEFLQAEQELHLVRLRIVLGETLEAYRRHLETCRTCRWSGPWCPDGQQLRAEYLTRWTAWATFPDPGARA